MTNKPIISLEELAKKDVVLLVNLETNYIIHKKIKIPWE
jgi:hypothetical protein